MQLWMKTQCCTCCRTHLHRRTLSHAGSYACSRAESAPVTYAAVVRVQGLGLAAGGAELHPLWSCQVVSLQQQGLLKLAAPAAHAHPRQRTSGRCSVEPGTVVTLSAKLLRMPASTPSTSSPCARRTGHDSCMRCCHLLGQAGFASSQPRTHLGPQHRKVQAADGSQQQHHQGDCCRATGPGHTPVDSFQQPWNPAQVIRCCRPPFAGLLSALSRSHL